MTARFDALGDVHSYAPRLVSAGLPYETLALTLGDPSLWAERLPYMCERGDGPSRALGEVVRKQVEIRSGAPLGTADYVVKCSPARWNSAYSREVNYEDESAFDWRRVPRQTFGFWFVRSPPRELATLIGQIRGLRRHARAAGIAKRHFVVREVGAWRSGWIHHDDDGLSLVLHPPRDVHVTWAGSVLGVPIDYTDCVLVVDAE